MKTIDEHYKDWCGESHTTNSCHPVHDSAECTDFAEYYAKQMQDSTIKKVKELRDLQQEYADDLERIVEDDPNARIESSNLFFVKQFIEGLNKIIQ